MGLRMSKISYKMGEVEHKLGYIKNEDGMDKPVSGTAGDVLNVQPEIVEHPDAGSAHSTSNQAFSQVIVPITPVPLSTSDRYHSNTSLSSRNGITSCVNFSWPKSAAEKLARKRKVKSTPPLKPEPALDKGFLKKSKKCLLKGIGTSRKKSESTTSNCSRAITTLPPLPNNTAVPAVSCVCTAYRRTNSDPMEQRQLVPGPGCSITVILDPMSLEHRLSAPHVLGVFNPEDYPIEDEDEKMRRQRAKEMSEGVELSEKFGLLSFNGSYQPAAHSQIDYIHVLVPDLKEITNCSFYWGKIDRYAAEKLLEDKPEGTFLLRDSAQEEYLFSVSFRRYGRSLHARIEQWGHAFSFDAHDPSVYSAPTVTGLIEHYKDPSYCMFFEPMLTVRLHRNFTFNLQHLARSIICNSNTYDSISSLPLPKTLKEYCREYHYKQRVRVRNFP